MEPTRRSIPEIQAAVRKLGHVGHKEVGDAGVAEGARLALEWVLGDPTALLEIERRIAP